MRPKYYDMKNLFICELYSKLEQYESLTSIETAALCAEILLRQKDELYEKWKETWCRDGIDKCADENSNKC